MTQVLNQKTISLWDDRSGARNWRETPKISRKWRATEIAHWPRTLYLKKWVPRCVFRFGYDMFYFGLFLCLSKNNLTLLIAEAHLVGAGFYQPFELLDRNATTNQLPNSATTDYNTFTCQRVVSSDGRSLQVIYNFPKNTNISHTMSVELKVKNSECSAWAWSWFVSGRCVKNSFMECSNKRTYSDATFSVCILTCPCLYSCDFLHLKFSRLQTKPDLDFSELCEVGLRLSDVEPPLKIFWKGNHFTHLAPTSRRITLRWRIRQ